MAKKSKSIEFHDTIYVQQVTEGDGFQYLTASTSLSELACPDVKVRAAVYKLHEVGEVVTDSCFIAE